jgi:diguanylate cyclase (GGDEF)-like protein
MAKRQMEALNSALHALGFDPILTHLASLVVLVDAEGSLIDWNPSFGVQKEVRPEAASLFDLIIPDQRSKLESLLRPSKGRRVRHGRVDFPNRKGAVPIRYDCLAFTLPEDRFLFIAEIAEEDGSFEEEIRLLRKELSETTLRLKKKDVELKAVIAQADEITHIDTLTYLYNRRQILKLLQVEVHRADRYKTPLSISMIDIDHFKNINDTLGHTKGDKVLVGLAKMLRRDVREADSLGRYGGEEFLMLLPNTNLKEASGQAERLCKHVRESEIPVGRKVHLTISIGIAEYKRGMETWQDLLNRADKALYVAKNAGRDRWATSD